MSPVQVYVRQVYGRPLIYPMNAAAQIAAQLIGVKTFNSVQIALIRDLGLTVEQVPDPASQLPRAS